MGTKYSTTSVSGYNSSAPPDDGSTGSDNQVTWAKIKTKLPDPLKTALESIDSKLVTAADLGPTSKTTTYTTVAGDHQKTLECSGTFTVSLLDATTATAGYTVEVNNQGSGTITVGRATAGDTINGTAGNVTITPKNSLTFRANASANGYDIIAGAVPELAGLAKTDGNFLVADGTAWVAESGATARTSLGLGTSATVNTGTSGATIPLLNAANTFASGQVLEQTDAGATGAQLYLLHNSASPAANDITGYLRLQGKDSAAATKDYAAIYAQIVDPTAGSVDGRMVFETAVANSATARFYIGAGLYSLNATGGDKGIDTINASAVYDDNVLLTCYAIEAETTGKVTQKRWDDATPDLQKLDGTKEIRTHERAKEFAKRAATLLDPKQYGASWKTTGHLPSMPSPADWDAVGKKMSVGDIVQRLWETVEVQAIHIDKLLARIEALEP